MKIALIGATGNVGSRILKEAVNRGHQVTAISRHPETVSSQPGVTAATGEVSDPASLSKILAGHDAVVSAVRFADTDARKLIGAVKASGVKRYVIVGGAASLEVAPGKRLFDDPNFPSAYRPEAGKGAEFLDVLRGEKDLDWTFISPSAVFVPGERTAKFRIGKDQLLVNDKGQSTISFEDYAIALLDELEHPKHVRERFTVGY